MSFRLKTILGIAIIELVVMLLLIVINQMNLGGSATAQLYGRAQATGRIFSNMVADAVISLDLATLDATIASAVESEALAYLRVRNADGIVLSQGGADDILARPFVADASFESAVSDHLIDLSTPIMVAGQTFGSVEIGMTTQLVEDEIASALRWNVIVAGIGMTLVAIFGYILGSILTRQLSHLRHGALAISRGELDHKIPVIGRDELAETATCFNGMAETLSEDRAALQARQSELLAKKARVETIVDCMIEIADGKLDTTVPDTDGPDEIGNMARATEVFQTAMRDVERARFEQQRLIKAIDQLDDQVAIFDTDGAALYVNEAFRAFNAETLAELEQNFRYEDFLRAAVAAERIGTKGDPETWIEERVNGTTASQGPFEVKWAPDRILLTVQSKVPMVGTILSASDITELRQSQAQLVHTSKLATLGEMATGIAHELNQPLGVIRMASNNLIKRIERGLADDNAMVSKLTRIEEQTERAAQIINHMRIFGRAPTGEPDAFDLRDALQATAGLMRAQVSTRGITLDVNVPEDEMPVRCEKVLIEQVILNLLSNARDAIEESGAPNGQIELAGEVRDDGSYAIIVSDSGKGIPEHVLDKLYNPFFTTKEPGKGTGLGLSISFGIVRDFGGEISAANTGRGARFEVLLPGPDAAADAECQQPDAAA